MDRADGVEPDLEEGDEDDGADLVELDCPTCDDATPHEVLRAAPAGWTVQCAECGTVRTLPAPKQERFVQVPAILSEGAASRTIQLAVPLDRPVQADDEFEFEGHRVRVTAVETQGGVRPKSAPGRDVKVLYAVVFDTVRLHYTLNQGEITRSFQEEVAPEEEIHVGTVREVQGVRLVVKTLKSDQNRTLHRGFLLARSVRRVFCDLAPSRARPGAKVGARRRGPPQGARGRPGRR